MENRRQGNWYGSSGRSRASSWTSVFGNQDRRRKREMSNDQMGERTNAYKRNFEEDRNLEWRLSSKSPGESRRRNNKVQSGEEQNRYSETWDDSLSSRQSNRQSRQHKKPDERKYLERNDLRKASSESINRVAYREDREDRERGIQDNHTRDQSHYRFHDRALPKIHDQKYLEDDRYYNKSKRSLERAELAKRSEFQSMHPNRSVNGGINFGVDGYRSPDRNSSYETIVLDDENGWTYSGMYSKEDFTRSIDRNMHEDDIMKPSAYGSSKVDSYGTSKKCRNFFALQKDISRTSYVQHEDWSPDSNEHSHNSEYNYEQKGNKYIFSGHDNQEYDHHRYKNFDTNFQSTKDNFMTQRLPRSEANVDEENESIVKVQQNILYKKHKLATEMKNISRSLKEEIKQDIAGAIMEIFVTEETDLSIDDILSKLEEKNLLLGRNTTKHAIERELNLERYTSNSEVRYKMDITQLCKSLNFCMEYQDMASREQCDCDALHVCKFFILSVCTFKDCKFGHTLNTEHNIRVLKQRHIQSLTLKQLKNLIQRKENRILPGICKFYNRKGGCKHEDGYRENECSFLHVCNYYIKSNCKFDTVCKRSHDFHSGQPLRILRLYGVDQMTSEEILALFDKMAGGNDQTNSTDTEEKVDSHKSDDEYIALETQKENSQRYFLFDSNNEYKLGDTYPDTGKYSKTSKKKSCKLVSEQSPESPKTGICHPRKRKAPGNEDRLTNQRKNPKISLNIGIQGNVAKFVTKQKNLSITSKCTNTRSKFLERDIYLDVSDLNNDTETQLTEKPAGCSGYLSHRNMDNVTKIPTEAPVLSENSASNKHNCSDQHENAYERKSFTNDSSEKSSIFQSPSVNKESNYLEQVLYPNEEMRITDDSVTDLIKIPTLSEGPSVDLAIHAVNSEHAVYPNQEIKIKDEAVETPSEAQVLRESIPIEEPVINSSDPVYPDLETIDTGDRKSKVTYGNSSEDPANRNSGVGITEVSAELPTETRNLPGIFGENQIYKTVDSTDSCCCTSSLAEDTQITNESETCESRAQERMID